MFRGLVLAVLVLGEITKSVALHSSFPNKEGLLTIHLGRYTFKKFPHFEPPYLAGTQY